jgi:hypothetical protein
MRTTSVAYLHGLRQSINVAPLYQRQGEVWTRPKQQLLIDSLLNGFDIPKIYLHDLSGWQSEGGRDYRYALVDGRQRLEALWDFLDGRFALSRDFTILETGSASAAGLTYSELQSTHPELAALFSATSLDVMLIRTDDLELIEEMFSRLNEAVPLNAAEKRNGRGGPLRATTTALVARQFFSDRLPFSNSRYRHLDLATKFLFWARAEGPADTKKSRLDDFWEEIRNSETGGEEAPLLGARVEAALDLLSQTFVSKDKLLSSIGMVSVYFLLYMELVDSGDSLPTRNQFEQFDQVRKIRHAESEEDLTSQQRRLLEFDRLSQSPNDESALKFRLEVLRDFLANPTIFEA